MESLDSWRKAGEKKRHDEKDAGRPGEPGETVKNRGVKN